MTETKTDVLVIGAGPAGYVAALRCAQLGFETACVDDFVGKDGTFSLGGTCLNVGCIPSKALLESSEHYHLLRTKMAEHGVGMQGLSIDLAQMILRKDDIVRDLTKGIEGLFRKNNIAWRKGRASLAGNQQILSLYSKLSQVLPFCRCLTTAQRAGPLRNEPRFYSIHLW